MLTVAGRIFYETNFAPALRIQGTIEEMALDLLSSAAEKLPMLVNASECRDDAGDLLAIRVTLIRAKDRRGYERDLHARERRATQRLNDEAEVARLREQFIAVLGHDLRNPLASIVGAARLLRREGQSEKALKVIQMMEASVDRMAGLIDDVMDFARGRLGRGITIDRRPTLLGPVLEQVVAELETAHPACTVLTEIAASEPVGIDVGRLSQMVSNLLANAISYGDPKAPIILRAKAHADGLEIAVANRGPPIPPAAMERLFDPFFRGEVRASQQGLGLGLHIASEIAKAHGGALSVVSDAQQTCFSFSMPSGSTA
jgi:sigma-B regulation protein RsbU (phosphoserine phosphatase)